MENSKVSTNSKDKMGHTYIQWIIAIAANITTFTYGLQAGWISPMTRVLQSSDSPTGAPLTDFEISWIASILCLVATVGVPLYAYIADAFGRRAALIAIAVPQALCWIIKLTTSSTISLIIARIFSGIAAAGCFNVIPLYIKEISQDNVRGLLGSLLILIQNTGVLCMYILGAYLSYDTVLYSVVAIPILNLILLIKAPESPPYLVKIGEYEKAAATLAFLRGLNRNDKFVERELSNLKNDDQYYKSLPDTSFYSILTVRAWRRTFIVLLTLMSVQALNGSFAIITYASNVLSSAGITVSPELQSLSFPAVMILGSIISMNCVEKIGRKPVIVTCFLLTAFTMASLSTVLILNINGYGMPSWITVFCIIIILSSYAAGISSVPYILMSEMFNFQIRAKAVGAIVMYAWFITFIQLAAFAPVSNAVGLHNTFYIFAGINLIGFFVSFMFLPETKSKTIEEIEILMAGKKT